jgi:hypothetical protein
MVDVFFFANGARNCSIVGATFCRGFEVSWIYLLKDGLKKGGLGVDFAQLEHIQAPSLRERPRIRRGKVFMFCVVLQESMLNLERSEQSSTDGRSRNLGSFFQTSPTTFLSPFRRTISLVASVLQSPVNTEYFVIY